MGSGWGDCGIGRDCAWVGGLCERDSGWVGGLWVQGTVGGTVWGWGGLCEGDSMCVGGLLGLCEGGGDCGGGGDCSGGVGHPPTPLHSTQTTSSPKQQSATAAIRSLMICCCLRLGSTHVAQPRPGPLAHTFNQKWDSSYCHLGSWHHMQGPRTLGLSQVLPPWSQHSLIVHGTYGGRTQPA